MSLYSNLLSKTGFNPFGGNSILIRDILNKMKWDPKEDIRDYVIVYIHRGALNDRRQIPAHLIEKVYVGSFLCTIDDEETIIPFHRILEIRNIVSGEIVYRKRDRPLNAKG